MRRLYRRQYLMVVSIFSGANSARFRIVLHCKVVTADIIRISDYLLALVIVLSRLGIVHNNRPQPTANMNYRSALKILLT